MVRTTRAARKPARPYHHGNLRRGLLDEALATIRTDGVDGLTLREIGARLGVSRTALYRHFADKRALLTAVATEGFRMLREQLVTAWEDGGTAAFESMGMAYIRFAAANPAHYRVMFGGFVEAVVQDAELAVEAAGAFQALLDAITALQRDGVMRTEDPGLMATHVWALVHGIAMLAIDGQLHGPATIDDLTRYAFDRLRSGIAIDATRQAKRR